MSTTTDRRDFVATITGLGLAGAVIATVAVFSPSLIVLLAAVPFLDRMQGSEAVRRALQGILASFVGLLCAVALRFALATAW
jgi:chromate transporter